MFLQTSLCSGKRLNSARSAHVHFPDLRLGPIHLRTHPKELSLVSTDYINDLLYEESVTSSAELSENGCHYRKRTRHTNQTICDYLISKGYQDPRNKHIQRRPKTTRGDSRCKLPSYRLKDILIESKYIHDRLNLKVSDFCAQQHRFNQENRPITYWDMMSASSIFSDESLTSVELSCDKLDNKMKAVWDWLRQCDQNNKKKEKRKSRVEHLSIRNK